MEKLQGLLHEGTIINLRMLFKLSVRYKVHFFGAVLFFVSFLLYNQFSQPVIYAIKVPMKEVIVQKVSSDLTSLLPEANISALSLEELTIALSNYSFLKNFASLVVEDPNFDQLNFGRIESTKSLFGRDLKLGCIGVNECIVARLADELPELFYLEKGPTKNRFTLVTNAIDKKTVYTLSSHLVKAIEQDRIRVRQYTLLKEIKSVGNLIEESRSVMKKMGGYRAMEEQEKLQNNIADLKERIRLLQSNSSLEMANVSSLQAKLMENKKSTRMVENTDEKYEEYQKAQRRLEDIKLNIAALSNIEEEKRTASDKLIISQLREEQSSLLKILPPKQDLKSMELSESFKEKQRGNSGDFEFDYLVSKNKISRLKVDYESSKAELNEMLQKKLINENKVGGMKADLDFLKSLESKQMSLKLLSATMNSDLVFEDGNQQVEDFRKSSFIRTFLYSFSFSLLLYILSILARYSSDDRIYGEEEIRMYLKDLDFVGEAPSFE
ncbi:MAG: hypothetical protein WC635_04945 [Bacteriovorax sp.]|jgi:hypothetical protein